MRDLDKYDFGEQFFCLQIPFVCLTYFKEPFGIIQLYDAIDYVDFATNYFKSEFAADNKIYFYYKL